MIIIFLSRMWNVNSHSRYECDRFLEINARSRAWILQYKQHIVRTASSDATRSEIIENLDEGEALAIMDFSQKLLPSSHTFV